MAYQQSDLDALDRAMLDPTKKTTLSDGRSIERYDLDQLRRLRADVKADLVSSSSQVRRRTRVIIGRVTRG